MIVNFPHFFDILDYILHTPHKCHKNNKRDHPSLSRQLKSPNSAQETKLRLLFAPIHKNILATQTLTIISQLTRVPLFHPITLYWVKSFSKILSRKRRSHVKTEQAQVRRQGSSASSTSSLVYRPQSNQIVRFHWDHVWFIKFPYSIITS